jgi:hypothetical protein
MTKRASAKQGTARPLCALRLLVLLALSLVVLVPMSVSAPAGTGFPTRFPTAPRIVAIGDLHGDLNAARRALLLAGAIDDNDRWVGGDLVVVQTGDQLDRGDDDRAILDLFVRLAEEARRAGGAVHVLNGNHELMNAALDLRYVKPAAFETFGEFVDDAGIDSLLASYPEEQRGRVAAFRPGGPYAKVLAERNTMVIIGDNVFVHGGITPEHVAYGIEYLNAEIRAWLLGEGPCPEGIHGKDSPTWVRSYSLEVDDDDCPVLSEVLEKLGAKRMIVGHTIQEEGINSYCRRRVWCIDVGMPAHYGGHAAQVLEIVGDSVRVLLEE